jgi:phage shock protein PspC (stress-responsive transcriptional regulator)
MVSVTSIWTIRRSATDAKLAGLCAGVARHWGVDPVLVRVGFALLALSGGVGVVLYLAGWLLLPVEGQDKAPVDELIGAQVRSWPREIWLAITAVCCIVAFSVLEAVTPFGFGPVLILAAIWYFGYYRNRPEPGGSSNASAVGAVEMTAAPPAFYAYPGETTPFTEAADAWRRRVEEHLQTRSAVPSISEPTGPASSLAAPRQFADQDLRFLDRNRQQVNQDRPGVDQDRLSFLATPDPVGLYVESPPPTAPVVVRRSQTRPAKRLRLVGLLVMVLAMAGLGTADRLGAAVPLAGYFGAALLVVGLTLVAGTWFGRARGILASGLLLVFAVVGASLAGPVSSVADWKDEQHSFTSVSQLPTVPLTQEAGRLTVDLSTVPMRRDTTVAAHVGIGSLVVTVPKGVNVVVKYDIGIGFLTTYGEQVAGGRKITDTIQPADPVVGAPTLTLLLSVDKGEVRVQR